MSRTPAAAARPCPRRRPAPRRRMRAAGPRSPATACYRCPDGPRAAALPYASTRAPGERPDRRPRPAGGPYSIRRPGHRVAWLHATGPRRIRHHAAPPGRGNDSEAPACCAHCQHRTPSTQETGMAGSSQDAVRIEPSRKRVRAYLDGELVADTTSPFLVWEIPYYPTYFVPAADVRAELVPAGATTHAAGRGDGEVLDVKAGSTTAPGAALRYPDSPLEQLRDLVRLDWHAMSEWLEEDEPVYYHPRDPYHRVDILGSSRHVRVEVDGVTVADSQQPRILFETGLPPRYYLPLIDVRQDLLRDSATKTHCPYKGTAGYWSVDAGKGLSEDIVWIYRSPLPESQKVAGLACFYDEKVTIYVDDVRQEKPLTPFS